MVRSTRINTFDVAEFAEHKGKHGGDEAYGVKFPDLFTKAADAVAEILKGKMTAGEIGIWTADDEAAT